MYQDRSYRVGLLNMPENNIVRKGNIGDFYHVEDTVFARGKFANVRKATHKITGVSYAAKYIKKRRRAVDQTPEIFHEIAVLLACESNDRIVKMHEVYETSSEMIIVLELAAGGELQCVFDNEDCLTEADTRKVLRQILEGLAFLHDRRIAHLDIKPQNILLSYEDTFDDVKLCDFGVSRILEPGVTVQAILGTTDYVSPEILKFDPITLAADIWSIGVLSYVLLTGFTPFSSDDKQVTYLNISQGNVTFEDDLFSDISAAAIDFIKTALVLNPIERPTVHELLQHSWLSPKLPTRNVLTPSTAENSTTSTTPKSTPVSQRKGTYQIESTTPVSSPKQPQRKSFDSYTESPLRSFANCLCAQCGTTCRHLPHTPVSNCSPTITVDRGILC